MLAHSFLIKSKLLVTRTSIKARMSLISGLWFPWPIYMFFEMRFDLGTLDSGERSLPFGLLVDRIIIKVAGNQDRLKSLDEFDFGPNQTTHFGVTCPWMTKILHFWTWIFLRQVDQSWSNFMCSITGSGERLHNVLRKIGSKLWCPWQQKAPIDL